MKKIFLGLLFINFHILHAQSPEWFNGSIVLSSCEVLVGRMSVEASHDLVLFEHDGTRDVYPAHKITSLYFYDHESNINRRYLSIKEDSGSGSTHQLYEVVLTGEVDVLRRKKSSAFSRHASALDFNYFVRYREELSLLRKFKKKVLPHLHSEQDERLENFIAVHRLAADLPANALRIIEYYNSLSRTDEPIARFSSLSVE